MTMILFLLFVALMLLYVPISFSLLISSTLIFIIKSDFALHMIPLRMFDALNKSTLMAIPFFVLAGVLLSKGGSSRYLIEWLRTLIGHFRGGLGIVAMFASAIFAAISGSSPATAAAVGTTTIPGMIDSGYSKRYSMGLVAAAGTLGILIPPSLPLILYGVVAEESIGKLFMAGVIPGLLLVVLLTGVAIFIAKKNRFGELPKCDWKTRWAATKKAVWGLFMPVMILGLIYTGITTPTEAAAIAVGYGLIVSVLIYKEVRINDLRAILVETAHITSMIYVLITGAMLFSLLLTYDNVPQMVTTFITQYFGSKWSFLIAINCLFFIMGTFLDPSSIILIVLPILLPVIELLGINTIHFAIIMTINMELAMLTPPLGINLFVVSGIAHAPVIEVIKGSLPFLITLIVGLILVMVFPSLALYLPGMLQ